mgnify:CR=1 FL=1
MITNCGNFDTKCVPTDMIGLSTDQKPVNVANASTFYEMDTKTLYMFDAQNRIWHAQ